MAETRSWTSKTRLVSRERFEKPAHAKPPSRKGDCAERMMAFEPVHHSASISDDVSIRRLNQAYPNAILVHTPVHTSWLNPVEIEFFLTQGASHRFEVVSGIWGFYVCQVSDTARKTIAPETNYATFRRRTAEGNNGDVHSANLRRLAYAV